MRNLVYWKNALTNRWSEQKGRFLGMLLGSLGANLLGNLLDKSTIRAGEGTIRSGQYF